MMTSGLLSLLWWRRKIKQKTSALVQDMRPSKSHRAEVRVRKVQMELYTGPHLSKHHPSYSSAITALLRSHNTAVWPQFCLVFNIIWIIKESLNNSHSDWKQCHQYSPSLSNPSQLLRLSRQSSSGLAPRRTAWHKEMSCFSVSPVLDCETPIHHKIHLLPVMEQLGYRHQAELQEGAGKGRKGRKESHCKGWHQISTLLGSSLPLVFPSLVHSLMKNSQRTCAPTCYSRRKKRILLSCLPECSYKGLRKNH